MLVVTSTLDPGEVDHVGIVVSVAYIEQEMGAATNDADVSDVIWLIPNYC